MWQTSHCVDVGMCVDGLDCALTAVYAPLWQLAQLPGATGPLVPAWFMPAGANAV